jgi:serine/threonine protein kinase/WD40 repeat protein/tetratricopeptide (TPR) repeat protein
MAESAGARIGAYKLLQPIGEGGMGSVWLAEQQEPIRRLVALKIIKAGMDSAQVIARFEAERQALALMDHPHIARVFDGGTTQTGRPYFVMELVKGTPITRYCDEHRLTPRQRLELFVQVCEALQHAHQKGIIHRDLKPSNVLVAPYDGRPVVKVIDFGVAKATGQRLTERTMFTELGTVIGTLEYMSPEQAELNNQDIDTRSDIYALGVLLYELLTGTTPLTRDELRKAAFTEMLRLIREEEPPRPSTRLTESKDSLPSISAQRQMEPARLSRLVRGELDCIVMKALEKDRNRRYETANGFAQDLRRYLADEPVEAQPPTLRYRLGKFLRRHKRPVLAGALVLLALVVGIIGTTWGMLRESWARAAEARERQRADDNARKAHDAQTDAEQKADEIRQRVVRLSVANGARLLDEGDLFGSLPWFVDALKHDQGSSEREANHRIRLAAILDQCPRLTQVWFHDGPVYHVEFSPDGRTLVTAGADGTARFWDVATGQQVGEPMKHSGPVLLALFTPNGRRLFTHCSSPKGHREARLWDVPTGRPIHAPVQVQDPNPNSDRVFFSPDGSCVLMLKPGLTEACLLDTTSGQVIPLAARPAKEGFIHDWALFSPDSRRVLLQVGDTEWEANVQMYDTGTGKSIALPKQVKGRVANAAFSAEGQRLVIIPEISGNQKEAAWRVWDLVAGKEIGPGVEGNSGPPAFSADGLLLTTNSSNVHVWDVATGKAVAGPLEHGEQVLAAAFASDGRHVATLTGGGKRRVWDISTGEAITRPGQGGPNLAMPSRRLLGRHWVADSWKDVPHLASLVVFSPNGLYQMTLNRDGTAQVWHLGTGEPITPPLKHASAVNHACFSPDGGRVATACADGTVRLWDFAVTQPGILPLEEQDQWYMHWFNPDARTLLLSTPMTRPGRWEASTTRIPIDALNLRDNNLLQLWDIRAARPLGPVMPQYAGKVGFSANGEVLASANRHRGMVTANTRTGSWTVIAPEGELDDNPILDPILSPDGQRILLYELKDTSTGKTIANLSGFFGPGGRLFTFGPVDEKATTNELRVWDQDNGKLLSSVQVDNSAGPIGVSLSGDGQRMLIGDDGSQGTGLARIVDVKSGKWVGPLLKFGQPIRRPFLNFDGLNFDGSRLLTDGGGEVRLWNVETGQPLTPVLIHGAAVVPASRFSSDGRWAALVCEKGTAVQVWDAVSGEPVTGLIKHPAVVSRVQFSPDNRFLLTVASTDAGQGQLWDARTGEPITPPMNRWAGMLSSDGRPLLTDWPQPRIHELTADDRPVDELELLAQALAMSKIHKNGAAVRMEGAEFRKLWPRQRARSRPEDAAPTRAQTVAWHYQSARDCAAAQQWPGAILHLDQVLKLEPSAWNVYFDRGRAYCEIGQHEPAVADFAQAIACRADRYESWLNRADAQAELGHWDRAAADFEKAIDLGVCHIPHWRKAALCWLAARQPERYRSLCARLLKADNRREVETDPAHWAWVFVLASDAVPDLGPVVKQMETWLEASPKDPERLLCLGAVLYRAGRFAQAEQKLQEAVMSADKKGSPFLLLLLAMTQHQQKQGDKAHASLGQARQLLEQQTPRHAQAGASWPDRLTGQLLRREAEALIEGKKR